MSGPFRTNAIKIAAGNVEDFKKFVTASTGITKFDADISKPAEFLQQSGLAAVPVSRFHDAVVKSEKKFNNRLRFDLNPEEIDDLCKQIMDQARKAGDAVVAVQGKRTFENTVLPLARADQELDPLVNAITFPSHVSDSKEIRDASSKAETELDAFQVEQSTREDVYKSLMEFSKTNPKLKPEEQRLLDRLLRDFKRKGLHLSEDVRKRVKEIQTKMGALCIEFSKNLGEENTKFEFTADEIAGLPKSTMDRLSKTDDGKFIVSLKYPEVFPALKYCKEESTRKKLEKAFNCRCLEPNTKLMEQVIELRAEQAKLMGMKSHAEFILDIRMAKTPESVKKFLTDLSKKLDPLAAQDMAALLKLKEEECKEMGKEFDGKINMWDMQYYQRMREEKEYGLDHQKIKEYFPLEQVTSGLLGIYQTLLGLEFKEEESPHVWHEDVKLFNVLDKATGNFVGQFYLDLHPRDGKYGHAACFGLQPGCAILSDEKDAGRQFPVAACVCNFTKPTDKMPSLLTHREVETFFHEFGHVMHQLCTNTQFARFAGTAVERDFVEAPSQMLENWCYEREALKLMSGHFKNTDEKLPDDLLKKIVAARNANAGLFNKRQIVFGLFDQSLHTSDKVDTAAEYARVLKEVMGLEATPGTNFAAGFAHLMGGYDASYYGYMWSEVYSTDMFVSKFKDAGVLNPKVGMEYRTKILSVGGSRDAMESLKDFLGREPIMEPFLKSKGLNA